MPVSYAGALDKDNAPVTTTTIPAKLSPSIQTWFAAGDTCGYTLSRGYYDYSATCRGGLTTRGMEFKLDFNLDVGEYRLRIERDRVFGSSKDGKGDATTEGHISPSSNRIKFTKKYYRANVGALATWGYSGTFTSCGIVGEWHYPGNPPHLAFWRGKFGMWLQKDEDASPEPLKSQLDLLQTGGGLLTRYMTRQGY